MSDPIGLEDLSLVERLRTWGDEGRQIDRAPDRLVEAVMDDVRALPRRRFVAPLAGWRGVASYAALTAVIAIGVTLGILVADSIGPSIGATPGPLATPSPSAAPSSPGSLIPSPGSLSRLPDVRIGATAIADAADGLWVADRALRLLELDPDSAAIRRSVGLPRAAADLLVTDSHVWASTVDGALLRVDRADLTVDEVVDARGGSLALGDRAIWLGGTDEVLRIDPTTLDVTLRVPIPGRDARLGIVASGGNVWVATRREIQRLAADDGRITARIGGDATELALDGDRLWAVRGTELLRIDPSAATILDYLGGQPPGADLAVTTDGVWVVGPPGGGSGIVRMLDRVSGALVAEGRVPDSAAGLAIHSGPAWVAAEEAALLYRFVSD